MIAELPIPAGDHFTLDSIMRYLGPVCFILFCATCAFIYYTKRKFDSKQSDTITGAMDETMPEGHGKTERDFFVHMIETSMKLQLMEKQADKLEQRVKDLEQHKPWEGDK